MSVQLTYANTPPLRSDAQLGEAVKTSTLAQLTAQAHELWAASGELCFDLIFDGVIGSWETDVTTYVQLGAAGGSQYGLHRCAPLLDLQTVNNNGGTVLIWRAFVRNLQVQVTLLDSSYTPIIATNASALSADPQWIGNAISVGSTPIQRIAKIEARRLGYDTTGEMSRIICRSAPTGPLQIPGYL